MRKVEDGSAEHKMARPLPVNMLLAAAGGVLLVSGMGGKSIGDVLKGEFGKIDVKNPNIGSEGEAGQHAAATAGEGGAVAPSPVSLGGQVPSGSTFAPSPMELGRHPSHAQTTQEQAREIARILISKGITNPTSRQIAEARAQYQREGGHRQFETFIPELSPYV